MRKFIIFIYILISLCLKYGWSAEIDLWNFDKETVGKLAKGFLSQVTGEGNLGRWEIIEDKSASTPPYVLAQISS